MLATDDVGAGAPLVLLHAFPLDARIFAEVTERLKDDRRVLTPDLAGFGRSRSIVARTVDEQADLVARLLDDRGIDRAIVGGVSMGGYVTLALLRRHPDRLRGLVLADTRAAPDTEALRAGRDASIAAVREKGTVGLAPHLVPTLVRKVPDPRVRERALAIGLAQSPAGLIAGLEALRDRPSSAAALEATRLPVLVLVGAEDGLTKPAEMRALAEKCADATFGEVPRAGHLACMEAPESFAAAVRAFAERAQK